MKVDTAKEFIEKITFETEDAAREFKKTNKSAKDAVIVSESKKRFRLKFKEDK